MENKNIKTNLLYDKTFRKNIIENPKKYINELSPTNFDLDAVVHENKKDVFYFIIPNKTEKTDEILKYIDAAGSVSTVGSSSSASTVGSVSSCLSSVGSIGTVGSGGSAN